MRMNTNPALFFVLSEYPTNQNCLRGHGMRESSQGTKCTPPGVELHALLYVLQELELTLKKRDFSSTRFHNPKRFGVWGFSFMKKALLLLGCLALTGCASNGLTQISENEYLLSDSQYWSWNSQNVLKDVLINARGVCESKGKKMHVLGYNLGEGQNRAAIAHFECVDK